MTTTMATPAKTFEVLIVEDNQTDVFFIREVLKRSRYAIHTTTLTDGENASAYLRRVGYYQRTIRPDLILLDIRLPRKDGWEILREIRQDPNLRSLTVMAMSSSKATEDALRARELEADFYLVKPMYLVEFPMLLRAVERLLGGQASRPSDPQE